MSKKKNDNSSEELTAIDIYEEVIHTIVYMGIVIFCCFLILAFVVQRTTVDGNSMTNSLHDKDSILIDKISYRFSDPKRFDIIVFPCDKNTYYVKRIIGLPGETVQILENGDIMINGEKLNESYGKEVIWDCNRGLAEDEIVLGENEYFVLGDNRNDSLDSRSNVVGTVKRSEIVGKVLIRVYPFKDFGPID